jgi:F-type H+-transporting ATPase subunit a
MKLLKYVSSILLTMVMSISLASAKSAAAGDTAAVAQEESQGDVDVQKIIFSHIGNSYKWEIGKFGKKEVSIYLPVIVHSSTGWHVFSSKRLEEGPYEGLTIGTGEKYDGKIVEKDPSGQEIRPFDISITKNVLSLFMSSALLVLLVLLCAKWYKHHDVNKEAPTGIAALMEPVIMMIHTDVVRDALGDETEKYSPYLCTAFFWILLNNLLGIVPFFPGGANLTGNITITFFLAMCTFFAVNAFGNKNYFKDIFWPDVPWWLKFPIPLMPVIELFGVFTKPFALMVRLFANMMAGHILVVSLVCVIFVVAKYGAVLTGSMSVVSVAFGIFMNCLDLLVSFIQAYVFTVLSTIFISLAHQK